MKWMLIFYKGIAIADHLVLKTGVAQGGALPVQDPVRHSCSFLLDLSIFFLNVYQGEMSSVGRNASQISANKLYINIASMINGIYDASGNVLNWCNGSEETCTVDLSTTGVVLLRDMGKTIYLPNPSAPSIAGSQSTILRKVQLIPSGLAGQYGTGAASNGSASVGSSGEYYTGYIPLGGLTYGGGTGIPAKVARLN